MNRICYHSLASVLRAWYGRPIPKIGIDAGFGCPNRGLDGRSGPGCVYCNNASFSVSATTGSVQAAITDGLSRLQGSSRWAPQPGIPLMAIAYFQSYSNTWARPEILRERYTEAISNPGIAGLAISTRPDCIDEQRADILAEFGQKTRLWIELGLQTTSTEALTWIRRGHSVEDFIKAVRLLQQRDLRTVVHLIPGLPGESSADRDSCARLLADLGIWGIKFHHLQIVRDTPLEELARTDKIPQPRAEEYAGMVAEILARSGDPVVHRLHASCRPELLSPEDRSDPGIPSLMRKRFIPW
ncbi:MAG TPA: TIGR01212 family radical SAM protein [Spirochaetota bacterium]|nr:TIGR01212 family radical SAM protein [Spirochaetota bacterium]